MTMRAEPTPRATRPSLEFAIAYAASVFLVLGFYNWVWPNAWAVLLIAVAILVVVVAIGVAVALVRAVRIADR